MQPIADIRAWSTTRAAGVVRLLLVARSCLVDAEGALASDQLGVAKLQGRTALLQSLSIVSLCRGGEVDPGNEATSYDPFAFLDAEELTEASDLLADFEGCGTAAERNEWFRRVTAHVDRAEESLGLGAPLPDLRTPEGTIPALAVTRRWIEVATSMGVPIGGFVPT